MDAAAKTSEDTASTSLHIKGTPTASQETNCIPNNQNTAKTSIPSTSAQLKRRSFRRFLAISRRDGSTVLPLIRAGSRMIVVVAPMVSPALFSLLTRAPFLDSGFFSDVRIHVSMADMCRLWRSMSPSEARHTSPDPSHGAAGLDTPHGRSRGILVSSTGCLRVREGLTGSPQAFGLDVSRPTFVLLCSMRPFRAGRVSSAPRRAGCWPR